MCIFLMFLFLCPSGHKSDKLETRCCPSLPPTSRFQGGVGCSQVPLFSHSRVLPDETRVLQLPLQLGVALLLRGEEAAVEVHGEVLVGQRHPQLVRGDVAAYCEIDFPRKKSFFVWYTV